MDGHVSMGIYINAMLNTYDTLRKKQNAKYKQSLKTKDFDYMCFHTPFAKMVQKSFLSLVEHDIKLNPADFDKQLVQGIAEIAGGAGTSAEKNTKIQNFLLKQVGKDWQNRCERSLYLSKRLGNIYTGSLYIGLLSLICDTSISL